MAGPELIAADIACASCGVRSLVRSGIGILWPGDAPADWVPAPARPVDPGPEAPTPFPFPRSGRRLVVDLGHLPQLPYRPDPGAVRTVLICPDPGRLVELVASAPAGSLDGLSAELHSFPLADRAVEAAYLAGGWRSLRGPLVVLRELHRVVRGRLIVELEAGSSSDRSTEASTNSAERLDTDLELFGKAHWCPTIVEGAVPGSRYVVAERASQVP
jgi:hypothetical protein